MNDEPGMDCCTLWLGVWEGRFWESQARFYTRWDLVALFYSVVVNSMLLRAFRHTDHVTAMLPITMQMVVYLVSSVLQLAFIIKNPAKYRRHRYLLSAANRLVRLVLLTASTCMHTPAASAAFVDTMTSTATGRTFYFGADALRLLRAVLAHPLGYVAMANFVVPFRFAVPVQLATLMLTLLNARSQACALHAAADTRMQVSIHAACSAMARIMTAVGVVVTGPVSLSFAEAEQQLCSSDITAWLLLVLLAHVVIVLLLPCFVLFHVESTLKARFVTQQLQQKQKQLELEQLQQEREQGQDQDQLMSSSDLRHLQYSDAVHLPATLFAVVSTLVACLVTCAALISLLPPVSCDKEGWLALDWVV